MVLYGSVATGLVLLVIAFVVKKHHPHIDFVNWKWVHAFLMLLAGIGMIVVNAIAMNWAFGRVTNIWDGVLGLWRGMPSWMHMILAGVPQALPWSIGAVVVLIVVFHMLPKWGRGIHSFTPWLAFLTPAAVGVFPPLFSMISGG